MAEEDEFDAEAFFGVKEENFDANIGIDDDLMMKAIEIMTAQNPTMQAQKLVADNPKLSKLAPAAPDQNEKLPPPSSSRKPPMAKMMKPSELPDIHNKTATNIEDFIKPKSLVNGQAPM